MSKLALRDALHGIIIIISVIILILVIATTISRLWAHAMRQPAPAAMRRGK